MNLTTVSFLAICCAGLAATGFSRSPAVAGGESPKAKAAVVVDVRTPEEYASGHVTGSTNVPVDQIEKRIAEVVPDKSKAVYVHCRSGRRSAQAKKTLEKMGYSNITDLGSYDNAKRLVEGQ